MSTSLVITVCPLTMLKMDTGRDSNKYIAAIPFAITKNLNFHKSQLESKRNTILGTHNLSDIQIRNSFTWVPNKKKPKRAP